MFFQKWPNLPVLTTCFLLSFFQDAVIWSTINQHKPTPDVNNFPKFLWEVNSFLISPTTFELLNFEKWPHVALRNPKFAEEISGYPLMEVKALRPPARLNFPAAFISFCTTKKWLIFLLMWWNPLYGCCAQSFIFILLQNRKKRGGKIWTSARPQRLSFR